MIRAQNADAAKIQRDGVKRVQEFCLSMLPDNEREEDDGGTAEDNMETSVIVNQLACKEAGCPDVEVVITLLRAKKTGRAKLMFKIYKAAAEITRDEVEHAMRAAQKTEQEELSASKEAHDAHAHGHNEEDHGHAHGDDCGCEHGHDEGNADEHKKPKHEHDHIEH